MIALAVYCALVTAALLVPHGAPPRDETPVRLVFVEPPPPPPAPLGVPGGGGSAPALVAPKVPPPPGELQTEPARPLAVVSKRLRRAEPAAPKARPQAVAPPTPTAELAAGVPTGSIDGDTRGVAGGVPRGTTGGVVGGTGAEPVAAGQVAHQPVLVRRVDPVYPQQARRHGIEGLVLLETILDRDGRVEPSVKVLASLPMLDQEAVAAVRKWRFRPARDASGDPLRVILEIPIRFVLR